MIAVKDIHHYLSQFGVRPSVQRVAIMEYLLTHATHPTADEIFQALSPRIPTLSKTTVYNTLRLLAEHRAILLLDLDERNTRFDGDITPHAHFICRSCGKVYDLPLPVEAEDLAVVDPTVEVDDIQIYYKGYCRNCLRKID